MSARLSKLRSVGQLNFSDQNLKATAQKDIVKKKYGNLSNSTIIKTSDNEDLLIEYKDLTEEKSLGSGEFAIVKKMIHRPSKLQFAVKVLGADLLNSNENNSSNVMDLEVSIKIGNGSPFLIRFFGALYVEGCIWILTEVMDTSLDRFYTKALSLRIRLPEILMAKIAYSVVNGLLYLKNLKLLHRDIKPSNILINSNGEIKVCDFGISGFTVDSICKTWKGCQRYMAPEKIRITEKGYNIKSDIWSLGISLIEIATGVHPFSYVKGIFELSNIILSEESPKLDSNKYSLEFCSFIDECLVKETSLRSDLNNLLKHPFLKKLTQENQNDLVLSIIKLVVDEIKSSS